MEAAGGSLDGAERKLHDETRVAIRSGLGRSCNEQLALGRSLGVDAAVALALEGSPPPHALACVGRQRRIIQQLATVLRKESTGGRPSDDADLDHDFGRRPIGFWKDRRNRMNTGLATHPLSSLNSEYRVQNDDPAARWRGWPAESERGRRLAAPRHCRPDPRSRMNTGVARRRHMLAAVCGGRRGGRSACVGAGVALCFTVQQGRC